MKNVIISRITLPAAAAGEFMPRFRRTTQALQQQPGLVRYTMYEAVAADGQLRFVTVAVWASEQAVAQAQAAMQAAQPPTETAALYARLHITVERDLYAETEL